MAAADPWPSAPAMMPLRRHSASLRPRNAAQDSLGSAFAVAERESRWRCLKAAGAGSRSYMDHVTLRLGRI